jgi:agmatine deiminase
MTNIDKVNQLNNPLNNGYTFPFEGEEHLGTIILLPYRDDTWEKKGELAFKEFYDIIMTVSKYEHVYVIKSPKVLYDISSLSNKKNISIHEIDYDDSWSRDNTLIFLKNAKNEIKAVDFGFNAWGGDFDGLYKPWDDDNKLGSKLSELLKIEAYSDKNFILEGGSIHTNGKGTLITTEACLLSKGRNYTMSKNEIEVHLKTMLGIKKVIWLPHGIVNDETNEHVDNMACFLDEETVLLATVKDKNDEQYSWSMQAKNILEKETLADGRKIKVILVNCPNPYLRVSHEEFNGISQDGNLHPHPEGDRLAASYVNFYMGKDFIVLPKFNVEEDKEAYDVLNNFYQGKKKIYQIESRKILLGGGNIHCVTMQIPKREK